MAAVANHLEYSSSVTVMPPPAPLQREDTSVVIPIMITAALFLARKEPQAVTRKHQKALLGFQCMLSRTYIYKYVSPAFQIATLSRINVNPNTYN